MSVKSAVKIPDHLVEGGQEDRAYLASLPELEREAILFERAEKATRAAQKQEILDQLKSAQQQQQQQKPTAKRGKDDDFYDSDSDSDGYGFSDSDDLNVKDAGQRGESDFEDSNGGGGGGGGKKRLKTERSDRQSKLEKLRRQRKKKGDDQEEGEIDISLLSPPLSDNYSDHQQQQQRPTSSWASPTSVDRIEDADLQSLQIPRTLAEKLIHLPLFQQKCTGLFVRVFIGLQDGTKLPVYRCCQILAVEPYPRTYRLTDGSKCALSLRLAFGSSERNFRIDILSNSPLTPVSSNDDDDMMMMGNG